jgi:hypothetical protein
MMSYDELLEQLPPRLEIPTLGGRNRITILNHGVYGLEVINSKGGAYPLSRQDWTGAKNIRKASVANPWKTAHYMGLHMWTSYSLIHAAALLRHLEELESPQDAHAA